jgi:hypothetical protein
LGLALNVGLVKALGILNYQLKAVLQDDSSGIRRNIPKLICNCFSVAQVLLLFCREFGFRETIDDGSKTNQADGVIGTIWVQPVWILA